VSFEKYLVSKKNNRFWYVVFRQALLLSKKKTLTGFKILKNNAPGKILNFFKFINVENQSMFLELK
jgi:hypothetical protein